MGTVIDFPDDVRAALADEADRTGRDEADLILAALRLYLRLQDRPIPRSFGIHADPDLSGADSEDWLRANWRPS